MRDWLQYLQNNPLTATIMRYAIAGGCAAGVNFLIRFPLSEIVRFELAVTLAQGIGLLTGFLLYRAFVFRDHATTLPQQILAFGSVNLIAAIIVIAVAIAARIVLLGVGVSLPLAEAMAHAMGLAAGAPVNFCGHLLVTFRKRALAPG